MFFYPDPEPLGHCVTDVSPSYLTDGVFFNGRVGPTHKCVAKQLSPIPRGPNDPVAPRAEVNPRTLENWTVASKAWYVDNCGRNAKALNSMMGFWPKEKIDLYAGWKTPAFEYAERPIWWRGEIPVRVQCTVGLPDDYAFQRLDPQTDQKEGLIPRKASQQDHTETTYVPGAIYGKEHPEAEIETETERPGKLAAVKAKIDVVEGELFKDIGACDCPRYYDTHTSLICESPATAEEENSKRAEVDAAKLDPRWHCWHNVCDAPRNEAERRAAMLNFRKPYLHEINTWYSRNKPTKLARPLVFEGKRPLPECRFSNL